MSWTVIGADVSGLGVSRATALGRLRGSTVWKRCIENGAAIKAEYKIVLGEQVEERSMELLVNNLSCCYYM